MEQICLSYFFQIIIPQKENRFFTIMKMNQKLLGIKIGNYISKKEGNLINELYDLENDIGEEVNLYNENKEIVTELSSLADDYRKSLGDKFLDIKGEEVRPASRIANPKPLTEFDENHPYMYAEYDKGERG